MEPKWRTSRTPFETVTLGVIAELVDPDLRTEVVSTDRLSNKVYLHTQITNTATVIHKRKIQYTVRLGHRYGTLCSSISQLPPLEALPGRIMIYERMVISLYNSTCTLIFIKGDISFRRGGGEGVITSQDRTLDCAIDAPTFLREIVHHHWNSYRNLCLKRIRYCRVPFQHYL